MDRMTQILTGLVERSEEGKLNWHTTTTEPQTMLAVLGEVTVVISASGRILSGGKPTYQLHILDQEGRTVEVLKSSDDLESLMGSRPGLATLEQSKALERLFEMARRSAYDIDATLDELSKQLEAIR